MDVVLKDGVVLSVGDQLDNITSWVALEQEDWFEEEIAFLRTVCKPGWSAIDIGASHGVYSLAMASGGAAGVWAFEPASVPFERICRSVRLNEFGHCIFPLRVGVSSSARKARIRIDAQGECCAIGNVDERAESEEIDLVTLDHLQQDLSLPMGKIDFIRINAEGSELDILEGGLRFLGEQSPLVLFGVRHSGALNRDLILAFRNMGYGIYALVPGLQCLRKLSPEDEELLDPFTLNLFACKEDRAAMMEDEGWLLRSDPSDLCDRHVSTKFLSELFALPMFANGIPTGWAEFDCSSLYGKALLAWCASRSLQSGSAIRWSLLRLAQRSLSEALAGEDYHPAVTMLSVRVLADLGERSRALLAANAFLGQMLLSDMPDDRPLPPAYEAFDSRERSTSVVSFLYQSIIEFSIARRAYSGFVDSADSDLFSTALENPDHSADIERRAVLFAARDGVRFSRYRLKWILDSTGSRNVRFWQETASSLGFFRDVGDKALVDLINAGDEYLNSGMLDEALSYLRQAADMDSSSATVHFQLGVVYMRLRKFEDAAKSFREALKLQSDYCQAANNLGLALVADHRFAEAEVIYRACLADNPDYFDIHFNFANCLQETGRSSEAMYYLRQALRLKPDSASVLDMLGVVLISLSRTGDALPFLKKAVELEPLWGQSWNNLGRCYFIRGQLDEADRCYRESLKCAPGFMAAWTNRLMICNYRTLDRTSVFDLHRCYGDKVRETLGPVDLSRFSMTRDSARRLRVGFVSGDFRRHSVSYFVEGVLQHLSRQDFRLFCYFNHTPDARTLDLKKYFNHWRDIKLKSDHEVVEQIVDDEIDILFDLAGHTSGNRMAVFAERPAPIQVTWIGYPNTSGLDTIDYRLTDGLVDPEGDADPYYTEHLWRLPSTFLCYSPPPSAPEVGIPPMGHNGFVTFGSFNTQFKLGDETLLLWSRVLKAIPTSRLLIKSAVGLTDMLARESLKERLVAFGVAAERIDVQEACGSLEDHLALYNLIDIALDPFPYHGTTTTFESLWMGVPVVSLAGDRHASRVGVSILTNAGLPELLAEGDEHYIRIASELANDQARLLYLRETMRERLAATPLLDAKRMAHNLGEAMRAMWSRYCNSPVLEDSGAAHQDSSGKAKMKLHVGGLEHRAGWKILNAKAGKNVDFVGDVRDLTRFSGESCCAIYCSHVLEHLGQGEVFPVLNEFHRILSPGGRLYLSVPDLDTLAWLFLNPRFATAERFQIMRMVFGGQADEYDFHYLGLNFDFMSDYLRDAGFASVEHVESHGLFNDTSEATVGDTPISLNLVAIK